MRPSVVPPPCAPAPKPGAAIPTAPTPNNVMSFRMFCLLKTPSSRPARICEPSLKPMVRYTWRMSICAPNWSCTPALLICGANPKCTPRFRPASLPLAENVAKAGSNPVRTLEFVGPLFVPFVNTQKAFTFPENENDQPFDICIVRPCALAVEATPSAKPNNNSVRRFIRESLLGSLPGQSYRSCPRGANCNCAAPGTAEWERGPPTSNTRLASHLRLCAQTGESGAHLLESESIVLRPAAAPTAPGRASVRWALPAPARLGFPRRSGECPANAGAAWCGRRGGGAQH